MRGGRLRREDRLRSSRDFRRISQQGRRRSSSNFVLLSVSRGSEAANGASRLGLTVSRRVGGAVVRNRVKRRIREWFRSRCELPSPGLDLVVIARPSASRLDGHALDRELTELLISSSERVRGS